MFELPIMITYFAIFTINLSIPLNYESVSVEKTPQLTKIKIQLNSKVFEVEVCVH